MKGKQAYLVIKMGKKSTTTEHMNSRTGELVFISEYTLKAESSQEISIELRAGPEADSTSIGVGKVTIEDGALRKKVILYDNAQKMVGELYVDGKLREANGANYLRINSSFKKEDKNIAIDNINSSSPHLQNSRMGAPARSSRIALSGAQSEIKFSRSPRFMETEKKSDYCSYLGLYNFEFREKHSNRFYKGASIGKGVKSDFTLEKN